MDTAEVNVVIDLLPNAGENGELEICENNMPVDLFDSLSGTPDLGGVWTPSLSSGTGVFDPSTDVAGVYTYTVTSGVCGMDTAEVNVAIDLLPDTGENGELIICENSMPVDLFDSLGGTPDMGGTWSPGLSSGTGVFDPSIDLAGIYTYTVSNGICGSDNSSVLVQKTNVTPITDYDINIVELSKNNSIEVIINTNSAFEFSLDGLNYQSSNLFMNLVGGDYKVYAREIEGCGVLKIDVRILDYPKFFTPNNDGLNDYWKLQGDDNKSYYIYIYDRYGKLLKQLSQYDVGWDGFFNGIPMPSNDYWFKIVFMDGIVKNGHFTLKR
ncbi:gliding motility-associated C-terminal domain-containing protein [Flagellimonas pelagia]|uniref:Gliding motility-associated C-terminal domain-containing protein n=2 Tax=Flagellimonas pelagia TaxID=2306998 RepID=A0A3A1NT21_9FLAO|nr:gliding motility-associated C-terminal domain-containing protein [Allomuricauda maritima]